MHIAQSPEDNAASRMDRIFLFPTSLDDEIHASQAARYHVDSGNRGTETSFNQLYDAPPFRNTHWIPHHLERFAGKLPGSPGSNLEALLRANTLFPLFEIFGNATLNLSDDAIPVELQIRNLPKRIVGQSGKIKLCFDCLCSDLKEHGTPYIHRSHQIPGVDSCWKHGTRLLSCCPFCHCPFEKTDVVDFVLAPWEACNSCRQHLIDASFWRSEKEDNEIALDFARFTHDLLTTPTRPLSGSTLVKLYRHRIAQLDLFRKSQIDWKCTIAALNEHFGSNFLAQNDLALRKSQRTPWVRLTSESSVFDAPIGRHLLFAHFLFGQADRFWEAVDTIPTEITAPPRRRSAATQESNIGANKATVGSPCASDTSEYCTDTSLSSEKRNIDELLVLHPEWSIDDLWLEQPGKMRQLFRKDSNALAWLSERMNAKEWSSRRLQRPLIQAASSDDATWIEKFQEAARNEFFSTNFPTKATRNYLMQKAGWKGPTPPSHLKYPGTRQTLEALAESKWHYYARRILWAKLTKRPNATAAPSSIIIPAKLEHHRGKDLVVYFSDVPMSISFEPRTIMAILDDRGITKDWEGLPPNPQYYVPGRDYTPQYRRLSAITEGQEELGR